MRQNKIVQSSLPILFGSVAQGAGAAVFQSDAFTVSHVNSSVSAPDELRSARTKTYSISDDLPSSN